MGAPIASSRHWHSIPSSRSTDAIPGFSRRSPAFATIMPIPFTSTSFCGYYKTTIINILTKDTTGLLDIQKLAGRIRKRDCATPPWAQTLQVASASHVSIRKYVVRRIPQRTVAASNQQSHVACEIVKLLIERVYTFHNLSIKLARNPYASNPHRTPSHFSVR